MQRRCPTIAIILTWSVMVMLGGSCSPNTAAEHVPAKNILLISIDTLRADHVGAYGYSRPTTPNLDRFAEQAVRFDRAYSSSNWTLPGHAGIFTGLLSGGHGARLPRHKIRDDVPLLTETLTAGGLRTAAFVTHVFVSEEYGFNRGFQSFAYRQNAPASWVTDQALAWLQAADRPSPFFLFLHYFDLHAPYGKTWTPTESFAPAGCRGPVPINRALDAYLRKDWSVFDCITALYDADLAYVDKQLGRLFEFLERTGRLRDTLVIVTSDHGELMGKDEGASHYISLFEPEIRVPLIMHLPRPAGSRRLIEQPVSTIQLAPTLLEAVGHPPFQTDLPSLLPLLRGAPAPEIIAAETSADPYDQIALIRQNHKVILPPTYRLLGLTMAPALFDVSEGEKKNLWADRPELITPMIAAARQSGWYGEGIGVEITYRWSDAPLGAQFRIGLGDNRPPLYVRSLERQISMGGKVMEEAPDDFHLDDSRIFWNIKDSAETNGLLLVAEAKNFSLHLAFPDLPEGLTPPTFYLGGESQPWPETSMIIKSPTDEQILPALADPAGDFIRIRIYPLLHAQRLGSKAGGNAKLTDAQQKALRTLGYL